MKALSRIVNVIYFILLSGKAAFGFIAGLATLVIAGFLYFIGFDGYLVIVPVVLGGSGLIWIMQALEPFAGKRPQPAPQPKSIMPPRSDRTDRHRRHPARQNH